MAYDYSDLQATAGRLIERFGQAATLRKVVRGGTDFSPEVTETDVDITVVDLNKMVKDRNGTLTGETQRTFLISVVSGGAPSKSDQIVLGMTKAEVAAAELASETVDWNMVVTPSLISPAGTDLLYKALMAR